MDLKQDRAQRFHLAEGLTIIIALGVDVLGEPPPALHPVVWYGKFIHLLEQRAPQTALPRLLYGTGMLLLAGPIALIPARYIHRLASKLQAACQQRGHPFFGSLLYACVEGVSLKPFFALKMLANAGYMVRRSLEQHDLSGARTALQHLVSRDRTQLSPELAAAAAIESLAENVSDAVVAPLFYYALFGLPGAALYRLFNTFDSMIGYHGRYEYLGKAAARLDDLLNLIPARLTALLIIALAPLFGGNRRTAWQIWRRDAGKTESPNAGHPMATAAGALEIQLEKVDHYILGEKRHAITPHSIRQAEHMIWWVGCSAIVLTALMRMLWRGFSWSK